MADLISRQAAIDALCSVCESNCNKSDFVYNAPQDEQVILCPEHYALTVLPSAQPERKKGKWIKISPANIYECSECGKNVMTDDISAYDFCHGCGARMDGGESDE